MSVQGCLYWAKWPHMQGNIFVCYEWHMRVWENIATRIYLAFRQRPLCICHIAQHNYNYVFIIVQQDQR